MINENINNYIFLPLLFLILFLQITLIPQLFAGSIIPNLLLILLIAVSFLYKSSEIFYVSFFCAFILDIFSDVYFGPVIISILAAIFVSSYLGHYFLKKIFSLNLFLISFLGVVVCNVLYFVLINLNNLYAADLNRLAVVVMFEIIYAAIFIYPFVYCVRISIFNFRNKNEN